MHFKRLRMLKRKHYNIPIFVPHKGCPHDCVFCNQKKITGQEDAVDIKACNQIIIDHLESFTADDYTCEVAFFGGSFTGIAIEEQNQYLEMTKKWMDQGKIQGIRLSTRPDYINEEILDNLKAYGVTTIELGIQSLDPQVLIKSNRGHGVTHVYDSIALIKSYGFRLGLQMMIGLPGDTYEKSLRTAEKFIEFKPDCVRVYPTLVIKETQLETDYHNHTYTPLSLDEAAEWASDILMLFNEHNINVIRVGLQPTELLLSGDALVEGPFHSAFRQIAEGKLLYKKICQILDDYLDAGLCIEAIVIHTSNRCVSMASGLNKVNRIKLNEKYPIKRMKFVGDCTIEDLAVKITNERGVVIVP